jgi:hypothetical protein
MADESRRDAPKPCSVMPSLLALLSINMESNLHSIAAARCLLAKIIFF